MALRQIRMQGDDILLKPCKEIKKMDERLRQLIEDMFETMHEAQGVGLAAPQVGVLKRMMIVEVPEGDKVFLTWIWIFPPMWMCPLTGLRCAV